MRVRVVVLALLLAAPALAAQNGSASEVMTSAVRAYRDLDFEVAARLLRRVLTPPLASELDDSTRLRALTYLGAAEHYRDRPDSATAVFRRLVVLAPPYRPDTLIFPPEITRLYDAVQAKLSVGEPQRIAVNARDRLPRFRPPRPPAALHVPPAAPPVGASESNELRTTASAAGQVLNVRGVPALGFFGDVRFRRLELDVRYAEGQREALVEGAVALGFLATPWLSVQMGPDARRFDTPFGAERWVTWRLGGRGDVAIAGTGVRGHATLWRALGLQVNVPPGSGSAYGGEVGVTIDLRSQPFWFGVAYGIDQAHVRDAARGETVKTLTFTAGLRQR